MDLFKCKVCLNYFECDELENIEGYNYCYNCYKICKNCEHPHYFYGDYCYNCLEGELIDN